MTGPYGICFGPDGTLYFADNYAVKMLSASGIVSVFAGKAGTQGSSASYVSYSSYYSNGDGGAATSATFYSTPVSLWMDTSSNMFINDYGNSVIRKVSSTKIISVYAGMCTHVFSYIYFISPRRLSYTSCIHTHPIIHFSFPHTTGSYDSSYSSGSLSTTPDAATAVSLRSPVGIGGDTSGNLYIAETGANFGSGLSRIRVRYVRPTGYIYILAGNVNGDQGSTGDLGPATSATLEGPTALCVDANNNVYFADAGDQSSPTFGVVRKVYNSPNTATSSPASSSTSAPQSSRPAVSPTSQPSQQPTRQPTRRPSRRPSTQPTTLPTNPTSQPTRQPSSRPSKQPTIQPSRQPSSRPSRHPTSQPTRQPSHQPTNQPSRHPTRQPSSQPTR